MSALDPAMSVGGLPQLHSIQPRTEIWNKCPVNYFETNVSFLFGCFVAA